jgi:hypothetical protein
MAQLLLHVPQPPFLLIVLGGVAMEVPGLGLGVADADDDSEGPLPAPSFLKARADLCEAVSVRVAEQGHDGR